MRLKIIGGPLGIVIAAGLIAAFAVWGSLRHKYNKQLEARLGPDTELLMRSLSADGLRLQQRLQARVESDQVASVVSSSAGEVQQRTRAFDAANQITAFFESNAQDQSGKPDIVAIVDERGQVVARNLDPNRMFGTPLANDVRALNMVLRTGQAGEDLWQFEGKLLRATLVPLRAAGNVVGAVVLGYDLSGGELSKHKRLVGRDIALLLRNEIYSTTLEAGARKQFKELSQKALAAEIQRAAQKHEILRWSDSQSDLEGTLSAWPSASGLPVSVALLSDQEAAARWTSSAWIILLITALAILALMAYGTAVANSLITPLEALEEGVFAVINGRADQRIDIASSEYGGLAYRINQLINLYTGVSEHDEEGRAVASTGTWKMPSDPPPAHGNYVTSGIHHQEARVAALAAEPEAQYEARVYREYVQAKQRMGEDVSNISQDRFVQRLNANAEHLLNKNTCRMVRFEVRVDGTQVNLVPIMIP